MKVTELIPGQRYLFHYKQKPKDGIQTFRANFVGFHKYNNLVTIKVNCYEPQDVMYASESTLWCIDADMLSKIESLSEILRYKLKLIDDVLNLIDNFI